MATLIDEQEKYLHKIASIAEAGKAILRAAELNNVSVDYISEICIAMAIKYQNDHKK